MNIFVFILAVVVVVAVIVHGEESIAGGRVALSDELPYVVGIRYKNEARTAPFCAGGLISPNHVLTAAHCVTDYDAYYGRMSPNQIELIVDRVNAEDESVGLTVYASSIIIHLGYNPNNDYNDIALIHLQSPLSIDNSSALQLYNDTIQVGMMLTAAGWGFVDPTSEKNDIPSKVLRTVDIPVANKTVCKLGVPPKQFCAGTGQGKDTCQGDSGGIVTVRGENNTWVAVGIVSSGDYPCGGPGVAGSYVSVPLYLDWIDQAKQGIESCATIATFSKILTACIVIVLVAAQL